MDTSLSQELTANDVRVILRLFIIMDIGKLEFLEIVYA